MTCADHCMWSNPTSSTPHAVSVEYPSNALTKVTSCNVSIRVENEEIWSQKITFVPAPSLIAIKKDVSAEDLRAGKAQIVLGAAFGVFGANVTTGAVTLFSSSSELSSHLINVSFSALLNPNSTELVLVVAALPLYRVYVKGTVIGVRVSPFPNAILIDVTPDRYAVTSPAVSAAIQSTFVTAAALGVGTAAASTSMGKTDLIMSLTECGRILLSHKDSDLSWDEHPTQIQMNPDSQDIPALWGRSSATVMNQLMMVAVVSLHFMVAWVIKVCRYTSLQDAFATACFPGGSFTAILFFYQTSISDSLRVVFYTTNISLRIGCAVVFCVFALIPIYLYVVLKTQFQGEFSENKQYWALNTYQQKYGVLFCSFKNGCQWYLLVDVAIVSVLGILAAWSPSGVNYYAPCVARTILMDVCFLAVLVFLLYYRPFHEQWEFVFSVFMATAQLVAMVHGQRCVP